MVRDRVKRRFRLLRWWLWEKEVQWLDRRTERQYLKGLEMMQQAANLRNAYGLMPIQSNESYSVEDRYARTP